MKYCNYIYNLKETINQAIINNYISLLIHNDNERNNYKLNTSYLYDSSKYSDNIKEINISKSYIIEDILLYKSKILRYSYMD